MLELLYNTEYSKIIVEKVEHNFKSFLFFVVTLGIIYQATTLQSLDGISLFSWSQVFSDSVRIAMKIIPLRIFRILEGFLTQYLIEKYKKKEERLFSFSYLIFLFNHFLLGFRCFRYAGNTVLKYGFDSSTLLICILIWAIIGSVIDYHSKKTKHKPIITPNTVFFIIITGISLALWQGNTRSPYCIYNKDKSQILHVSYFNDKYVILENGDVISNNNIKFNISCISESHKKQ